MEKTGSMSTKEYAEYMKYKATFDALIAGMGSSHVPHKMQIFGMSEDFLIELHGLMEIADIKEEDVLKAMRNIAKVKREEVPF